MRILTKARRIFWATQRRLNSISNPISKTHRLGLRNKIGDRPVLSNTSYFPRLLGEFDKSAIRPVL